MRGFGYRWKPSRQKAREFAQKMDEIDTFCREHGIRHSSSSDSYYFTIGEKHYRVSNHTVAASDRGMYRTDPRTGERVQVRSSYHDSDSDDMICITAGKTRIVEIYRDLEAGYELDGRGYRRI